MARPSNLTEAERMLRDVDPSTAEGREAAQQILDWIEEQPTVPASLRRRADQVREQAIEAAMEDASTDLSVFWRRPLEQLRWLWEKNVQAGQAMLDSIVQLDRLVAEGQQDLAESTSPEGVARNLEAPLIEAAWPHMTEEQRREASERGVAPRAEAAGQAEAEPTTDAQRRLAREQAAGIGEVTERGPAAQERAASQDWGTFTAEQTQRYIDAGFPPEAARARAEADAESFGLLPDPLVGVPWDHTTTDRESQQRFARQQAAGIEGGGARGVGREPRFRDSDVRIPFSWPTEQIASMQRRMVKAGLLSDEHRRGWFDDSTQQAFSRLLGFANQRSLGIGRTLDQLSSEFAEQRDQMRDNAMASFQAEPYLAPDPDALRQRARRNLLEIGRRPSEISEAEIQQMTSVLSGEFKRAHQMRQEAARRQHGAQVAGQFTLPGEQAPTADLSDLEEVDPLASFSEWFASPEGFGGEIETRETSAEVARRGQTFEQGLNQMRSMVRQGGA